MKLIAGLFLSSLLLISCSDKKSNTTSDGYPIETPMTEDGKIDESKLPKFEFVSEVFDFGKIIDGEKVSYTFQFKNVGKIPLIISSANASCGCTVPSYSNAPIAPGASGKIDVVFDSKGKLGLQNKTITLVANTIPNTKVLYLRGEILEAK